MPKYNRNSSRENFYLDKLIHYFTYYCCISPFVVSSHYIFYPNQAPYPGFLLPKVLQESWIVYIVFGLIAVHVVLLTWGSVLFVMSYMFIYTFSMGPILVKDFRAAMRSYRTLEDLRRPKNLTINYRKIEILHKTLIDTIGPIFFPIQASIGKFVLICNYLLIQEWSCIDTVTLGMLICLTSMFQLSWISVLSLGGLLHTHASKTVKSWKYLNYESMGEAKYMGKFRKSCRPLVIGTPGIQRITMVSVLKFMQGIIRGTFRVLLAVRNVKR